MANSEWLARIKLAVEGKDKVVSDLNQTQAAIKKLSKTQVVTKYDTAGVMTGKETIETFKNMSQQAPQATTKINDFWKAMKRAAIVAPVWMLLRGAMMSVFNLIVGQGKFLVDLESSMARIAMVGKGTTSELNSMKNALLSLSYAYGVTASEAIDAAKTFAQQGRNAQETVTLTRAAMIASQILGTDIKTTVNNMTAAVEGFQIPVNRSMETVDRWVGVEKEFAVTAQDLADATKVAGAAANQLGITQSQMLGDITAIIETTRQTGNEAARGLSFIYARLFTTGRKTVEQIAKIPYYLDAAGNSTKLFSSTMRPAADIIGDLASKWGSFTEQEKLSIATSLGSMRQMRVLYALMQNYSRSLDAQVVALTSQGMAQRNFNILAGTAEFKAKALGSAMNVLTTSVANTGPWKGFLDILAKATIGLTAVFNRKAAEREIMAKTLAPDISRIETNKGEINSIEELIKIRTKLQNLPQSKENDKRLTAVNTKLTEILSKNPTLKLAVDEGSITKIKAEVAKLDDEMQKDIVKRTVILDYGSDIKRADEKVKSLKAATTFYDPQTQMQIAKAEQELIDLKLKYNEAVDLEFEKQKLSNSVEKEKKELEEDELRIMDEKINKRMEETKLIQNLVLEYRKANTEERRQIREKIRITALPEEKQIQEFKTGGVKTRDLMTGMMSNFSKEVKDAITAQLAKEYGIKEATVPEESLFNKMQKAQSGINVSKEQKVLDSALLTEKTQQITTKGYSNITGVQNMPVTINVTSQNKNSKDIFAEISKELDKKFIESITSNPAVKTAIAKAAGETDTNGK